MRAFEYASPTTRQQALAMLPHEWGETEIIAGGTDLLGLMKDDVVQPRRLINIKRIQELRGIRSGARAVSIGALTHLVELEEDATIRQRYPMLARAAAEAASPQIRNMATLGGNMCQRPRCWYFRTGLGLYPKDSKSGKSMVLEGDNRYHAILGNEGPAYFVSPSSIAPALIAYSARIHLVSPRGPRELDLEKFFVLPKQEGQREHDLAPDELVSSIEVPAAPSGARVAHYEIRQKAAFDWPLASCAVLLQMDGQTVRSARIVLGHVAPKPWLSDEAAQAIQGKPLNQESADQAAQAALAGARSLGRNAYKIKLARVAVRRALLDAAKGGRA